ncbi:phosphotransferase [Amycolatopsis anabasis]|uniref:phosphotransferase n=1 Tax=Amycolatopsis anabasis TaxID=1840409 RepID=UPI00131CD8CE|nr:phosphotransferase [Amycolatopsis anabasis]
MTVDTSSADDSTVGAGAGIRAVEAAVEAGEAVLAHRFGSTITLVDPEDLAGSGPATVVRAHIASSPFALPRTLVIKHYPVAPPKGEVDPFAQEAVSYQLFTALSPDERMCPELLAHDGKLRVLVIDDLGRAPTLRDKLRGSDARGAERSLLSWARSLGRLHASTASREADFNALLRRLGGPAKGDDTTPVVACAQLPALLEETLGVRTSNAVRRRAERSAEHARSASYRAFSPVDLNPDNNLVTSGGVRFLDFERGRVRNALVDAAHLRVPFVSCDNPLALPAGMSEAMVAAWRAEVAGVWPALADDTALAEYLLDSQVLQVWLATWESLPTLPPGPGSPPTGQAAALVSWWSELGKHAGHAGLDELAEHSAAVAGALDARYGPGLELALYPAFR